MCAHTQYCYACVLLLVYMGADTAGRYLSESSPGFTAGVAGAVVSLES